MNRKQGPFYAQIDLLSCHLSRLVLVHSVRRLLGSSLLWPTCNSCVVMRLGNVKGWIH